MSSRVHSRPVQQVKDVTCGGQPVVVRVRKRRYVCAEELCPRGTFTEVTDQLPARARLTTRLAAAVTGALRTEPRAVSGVATEHGLSWITAGAPGYQDLGCGRARRFAAGAPAGDR